MHKAYIISTGTELLLGSTVDTNSMFLAQKLTELGFKVMGKSIVGDNRDTMQAAFKTGLEMADLVVATGGLGPTRDDLTKEVVCELLGCELQIVEAELEAIKQFFARRKRKMSESNSSNRPCFRPRPGFYTTVWVLPDVPGQEWEDSGLAARSPRRDAGHVPFAVEPLLSQESGLKGAKQHTRIIKVFGPGESQVEICWEILDKQQDYGVALWPRKGN